MRNYWWKLGFTAVLVVVCFSSPGISRAFTPYIEHSITRSASGWGGGVAWYGGYIYEVTSSSYNLVAKDPVTGAGIGIIPTTIGGIQDACYDGKRDCWWVKQCGGYFNQIALTGGGPIFRITPPDRYGFGIFWGEEEPDVLWVTDHVHGKIFKMDANTGAVLEEIYVGSSICGIVKVGDRFWCSMSEGSGYAYIIEIDMDGNTTNSFRLPARGYCWDVGGMALDDEGYLWVEGGKQTAIYKINIGYDPTPVAYEPDIIDSGDYNGDGKSDIAIFRETTGLWAVRGITRFYFGAEEDIPVSGDYNNDGMSDAGIFRGAAGLWAIRNITREYFGTAGDIPVPGDYNGDGVCDPGIFRSSSGLWAIKDLTSAYWGAQSDLPVPGYYSRSRQKSIGIFRPSSGLWAIKDITRTYFGGVTNDIPLPSVAGGIGAWEPAIFRPSSGLWAAKSGYRSYFGNEADKPTPGDYDGYGGNEPAIFREASGLWAARETTRCYFGKAGDTPVSGRACNPSSSQMGFSYN